MADHFKQFQTYMNDSQQQISDLSNQLFEVVEYAASNDVPPSTMDDCRACLNHITSLVETQHDALKEISRKMNTWQGVMRDTVKKTEDLQARFNRLEHKKVDKSLKRRSGEKKRLKA